MSTKQSGPDAEDLQELFVEVTGDEGVTEEREGTDRREAGEGAEHLAGRSEQESLSGAIEIPDEAF